VKTLFQRRRNNERNNGKKIFPSRLEHPQVRQDIAPYATTHVQQNVERMMATLRLDCGNQALKESDALIHVNNGTLRPDGSLDPCKMHCRYRLKANYDPNAQVPALWLSFLADLLEEEDILTLQYSKHIAIEDGRMVRGFRGIRVNNRYL
jgi:hypothetical protein